MALGGRARTYHPLDPAMMARECRKLAAALRREAALGWGPVPMSSNGNNLWMGLPRDEAAISMDEQAARWEQEVRTGRPNETDRRRVGW